jgi:hypothetical protein
VLNNDQNKITSYNYLLLNNCKTISLQIILAMCAQIITTQSDSTDGNGSDVTVPYAQLGYLDVAVLAAPGTCTTAGVFPVPGNCSLYQVCIGIGSGNFMSVQGNCGSLNFDPIALECSSTYVCGPCTQQGFYCTTNTTFDYYPGPGLSIIPGLQCPSGFYCNQKCDSPCLNYIPDC